MVCAKGEKAGADSWKGKNRKRQQSLGDIKQLGGVRRRNALDPAKRLTGLF